MKGIIIIGFNKSPGAYIETQYPPNISSNVGLKPSDLMNIYALHRMRKMKPDYQKIKIKNIEIASFYSGLSIKQCIGYADKAITIILSPNEVIPKDFEYILRRYAYEVLPSINDINFGENFIAYYELLKKGEVLPFIDETYKEEALQIATVSSDTLSDQAIANVVESHAIDLDDLDFIDQFKELEDEEEQHEIENLREYITEQELIMNTLAEEIVQHNIMKDALEQQVGTLTEHYQNQNARIEQLVNTNISLKEKISKLRVSTAKNVDDAQFINELEDKNSLLEEELDKLKETVAALKKDKNILEEKLKIAVEAKSIIKVAPKEAPVKISGVSESKPIAKAQVIAKATASKDEKIREKWFSMDIKALKAEISKNNMNLIRSIVEPWEIKPKGRKKQDLVDAVVDFIQKKK